MLIKIMDLFKRYINFKFMGRRVYMGLLMHLMASIGVEIMQCTLPKWIPNRALKLIYLLSWLSFEKYELVLLAISVF